MPLIRDIEERLLRSRILELSDSEVDSLGSEDIMHLVAVYGTTVLMKLPPRESRFFDWVREHDPDVWSDLWADDEELLVTLAFLPNLQKRGNGFPICELETQDNYFFTPSHIRPEGRNALQGIMDKVEAGKELSIGEALMFQILAAPIDIWHFCHRYGVALERGKEVVGELCDHDWLVHLSRREDLVRYIEAV